MTNKGFRKVIAILLTIGIIIAISACSKSGNKDIEAESTLPASSTMPSQSASAAPAETTGLLGKYEPGITLTSVQSNQSFKYPAGQNADDNMWTREAKEKLGIDVKYDWTADASQYDSKLNINIASGNMPDFFMVNPQQFQNLAAAGQIADLTGVYEKYASPELKASMDAFPEGFESSKIAGKIMGLSIQGFGTMGGHQYMWIRDDWMKKYNLPAPKTMADVQKIAETFVANKPDGQANTYGISVRKDFFKSNHSLLGPSNAFHAYPGTWIKDNSGKIVYGSIKPEMKTALATFQDWYKKGIISKEFGVSDSAKENEDFINGKVGIIFGASWIDMDAGVNLLKKNPNAITVPYEIPSADSTPAKFSVEWPVSNYWVVNKNSKHPEALIKLANLYKKLSNSSLEEYRKFMVAENADEYFKMAPVYTFDPKATSNEYAQISKALQSGDGSKVAPAYQSKYLLAKKWLDSKDPSGFGAYYQASSEGAFGIAKKVLDENRMILTALHGPETPKYAKVKDTLLKMEYESFTNIIMGAPIEQEFNKFVENWKKLGGDEATKEINDTYNK